MTSGVSSRDVETRLDYVFRDRTLLELALTHASTKDSTHPSNERLEFLGDAVLGMVVAHFLFWSFPELPEGRLTRLRSAVVSTPALARFGRELGLDGAVRVGKGLQRTALSDAVLANVVEAVIGAVYLDGELGAVRPLILWGLSSALEAELAHPRQGNWKSRLQELTQQQDKVTPSYEVLSERGPAHRREFVVAVLVADEELGRGEGPSKKIAEQAAAHRAYMALTGLEMDLER